MAKSKASIEKDEFVTMVQDLLASNDEAMTAEINALDKQRKSN